MNHLLCMDNLKIYEKWEDELDALMNTARIYTDDIKMKFRVSKCATIVTKKGKKAEY